MTSIDEQVSERVRAANSSRAQFLSLAFAVTYFVGGVADLMHMGTLRNHGFMVGQLVASLATAALVRWTPVGRRHAGIIIVLGICMVSASGAAHLAQFGGLDGPWFYGIYTAPAILIPILLSIRARVVGTIGAVVSFSFVYWLRRPDLFAHPMAHIPVVYLITVSGISIALGRFVNRLELASFYDLARLEATAALLEARLRVDDERPGLLRREIARQLHDDVAQLITGARLHLDGWSQRRAKDDAVTRLSELLDELSRRARRMLDDLRTPPERGGLVEELERLRHDYSGMSLAVDVLVDDNARAASLGRSQVDTLVASAREALTNAVRHAGASEATVSVYAEPEVLVLEVLDNGGGRADEIREGYGLLGIRERVEGLGGEARLSDYEEGLRLSVILPRAERV